MDEEKGRWDKDMPHILDHFADKYWTPWYYNQVIGWLRIYAFPQPNETLDPHIVGEYFFVDAKRIRRDLKRKRFLWGGEAFALAISRSYISREIYALIRDAMASWMNQESMKKWTLDTEAFENVGPLVDWCAVLAIEKTPSA
jgi:hypothetical protein